MCACGLLQIVVTKEQLVSAVDEQLMAAHEQQLSQAAAAKCRKLFSICSLLSHHLNICEALTAS